MNEQNAVINPLKKWFNGQRAKWETKVCKHPIGETGWDLEARRKNCDLLIEAKYWRNSFISIFSGLVCAPLTDRTQRFMKTKKKAWCSHICWAIGTSYEMEKLYQNLLDYFARNLKFWSHYGKDLKMKYIFFVNSKSEVSLIDWNSVCNLAKEYESHVKNGLKEKRKLASELMGRKLRHSF
jgi:hypothetical protein